MTRGDVGNLVRHHSGELGLFLRAQDQAAVHIEEAAGQREGIHLVGINHLNGEGHLRIGIAHQVLPHAVDVFGDDWVIDHLRGALHFLRQPLPEGNLVLQGVEIHAFADAAVANCLHIFFRILWVHRLLLLNRRVGARLTGLGGGLYGGIGLRSVGASRASIRGCTRPGTLAIRLG